MLTELRLSNFRLFDDEVIVRFRPITILIGENNAGKSSVIKFLLMLQQSLDPGNPQFLSPEGDRVHLGIFSELKNSLTKEQKIQFHLVSDRPISPSFQLSDYISKGGFENIDTSDMKFSSKVEADVFYSSESQTGITRYSLTEESSDTAIIERSMNVSDDSNFLGTTKEMYQEVESIKMDHENPKEVVDRLEKMNTQLARLAAESEFLGHLRYEIGSLRHLLPIRQEFQRVVLLSPPPTTEVGQNGKYAIPHLHRMVSANDADYQFIKPHLRNVTGISDIDFEKTSNYMSRCLARNAATGARVLIADYGFGVSQCLPIFVQGAIMNRETFLMVEQPEAHLHPTAQLEMGSFFGELWNDRRIGSIIETHSDNILLRLRRLVATGELDAKDVSIAYFKHDEENKNMPIVKNLYINEDGSMQRGLPMQFFGKNVEEVLEIGAGRYQKRNAK